MSETEKSRKQKKERRLEKQIEVSASPSEVWKALTDPGELAKWFPLEARVTPGKGGKIFLSWGPDCEGQGEIVAWEPNRRLSWKENFALVEFVLEARGDKTVVRLIQTGFLGGEDWENEWFESTDYGWDFMLLGLQWSMERHPGVPRQAIWVRVKTRLSREEAYARLLKARGMLEEEAASRLQPGNPFVLPTTVDQTYSGQTKLRKDGRGFCFSVSELRDALCWVTIEGSPGKHEVQMWLSAFGLAEAQLHDFAGRWQKRLEDLIGESLG